MSTLRTVAYCRYHHYQSPQSHDWRVVLARMKLVLPQFITEFACIRATICNKKCAHTEAAVGVMSKADALLALAEIRRHLGRPHRDLKK